MQEPYCFDGAVGGLRADRRFAAQHRPCRRLRVGGIGLAAAPARLAPRADHLHHRYAPSSETTRQARPVAAGAFDADGVQVAPTARPVQEVAVAGAGRRERRHTQQPLQTVNSRRHMVVSVGVDPTDHSHLMLWHNDSALLRAHRTGRGTTGRDGGQCTHGAEHKAPDLLEWGQHLGPDGDVGCEVGDRLGSHASCPLRCGSFIACPAGHRPLRRGSIEACIVS